MSIVTLVSGGLDSTLMAALAQEEGLKQFPLFVDYGQLGRDRELASCKRNLKKLGLPIPTVAPLSGYGLLFPSGLTDSRKHIVKDAFLPGRNALFLTVAGAFAVKKKASAVSIGLLNEAFSLFPDQTRAFLLDAEAFLSRGLGVSLRVLAPLMAFSKADVVTAAKARGLSGTDSCHAGGERPCGVCISCREFDGLEV
jgi:7-cyano-7-deazaguanine synthase